MTVSDDVAAAAAAATAAAKGGENRREPRTIMRRDKQPLSDDAAPAGVRSGGKKILATIALLTATAATPAQGDEEKVRNRRSNAEVQANSPSKDGTPPPHIQCDQPSVFLKRFVQPSRIDCVRWEDGKKPPLE